MKEIKFRIWNTNGKCFHDWRELVEKNKIHLLANQQSAYPVMQFTGLKDINGVDIYEGDIVRMWYAPQATATGFISFDNGGFVFNTERATPNQSFIGECVNCGNSFTVLGNIYQNQELLK